ncbi:MAG TPA: hypothetical protein VK640_01330 [Actinomycetes bacterium]|nr:hypothetical protein [Actinomycetes bacterium]
MRWDDLFGDLEAQLDAAEAASVVAEVADRSRRESALLTLAERLGGSLGGRVGLHAVGAGRVDGRVVEVSDEWLLLAGDAGTQVLVTMSAVQSVTDLAPTSESMAAPAGQRVRLGLGVALRAIARDRSPVVVHLTGGGTVEGTLERVGADFVELTEHPAAEVRPRRSGAVRTVPFAALALVRSRA